MRFLEGIKKEAQTNGRLWLGGEMEFPTGLTCMEAYYQAEKIAEACGYCVSLIGHSILDISGGEIPGFYRLDWFNPDAKGPVKVELWSRQAVYLDE